MDSFNFVWVALINRKEDMEIPITNMTHHWTCSNQKVTKQHHEACVFYLRDIQKIHLEYILRKHTQLYMYIGVGLWDEN